LRSAILPRSRFSFLAFQIKCKAWTESKPTYKSIKCWHAPHLSMIGPVTGHAKCNTVVQIHPQIGIFFIRLYMVHGETPVPRPTVALLTSLAVPHHAVTLPFMIALYLPGFHLFCRQVRPGISQRYRIFCPAHCEVGFGY